MNFGFRYCIVATSVMDPSEEEDVAEPKVEMTVDEDGGDVTEQGVVGTEVHNEEKGEDEHKLALLTVQLYHERRRVEEGENTDQVQKQELTALSGRLESLETELDSLRIKVSYQDEFVLSLKDKTECPVCWEIPRTAPVPVCPNGHIVCRRCRRATCPTCRASMGEGKSLLAATIIEKVEHVCSFDDCNQLFPLGELENHEASCAYRKISHFEDNGALEEIGDLEELMVLAEDIRPLEEIRPLPGPHPGDTRAVGRIPRPGRMPFVSLEELRPFTAMRRAPFGVWEEIIPTPRPTPLLSLEEQRPFPIVRRIQPPAPSPSGLRMVSIGGAEQNIGVEYLSSL